MNITDTILPNKYKASRYSFERETEGLRKLFKKFYLENPSKYYVGEWHTHPNNLPILSRTDQNAIYEIVNDKSIAIKSPIFLIIGDNKIKTELGFYIPFKNKIYKYEQQN